MWSGRRIERSGKRKVFVLGRPDWPNVADRRHWSPLLVCGARDARREKTRTVSNRVGTRVAYRTRLNLLDPAK